MNIMRRNNVEPAQSGLPPVKNQGAGYNSGYNQRKTDVAAHVNANTYTGGDYSDHDVQAVRKPLNTVPPSYTSPRKVGKAGEMTALSSSNRSRPGSGKNVNIGVTHANDNSGLLSGESVSSISRKQHISSSSSQQYQSQGYGNVNIKPVEVGVGSGRTNYFGGGGGGGTDGIGGRGSSNIAAGGAQWQPQQQEQRQHTNEEYIELEYAAREANEEISRYQITLAAWKLRYYVEHLRLSGTRHAADTLREEVASLNEHINNLVEQNRIRDVNFTTQLEQFGATATPDLIPQLGANAEAMNNTMQTQTQVDDITKLTQERDHWRERALNAEEIGTQRLGREQRDIGIEEGKDIEEQAKYLAEIQKQKGTLETELAWLHEERLRVTSVPTITNETYGKAKKIQRDEDIVHINDHLRIVSEHFSDIDRLNTTVQSLSVEIEGYEGLLDAEIRKNKQHVQKEEYLKQQIALHIDELKKMQAYVKQYEDKEKERLLYPKNSAVILITYHMRKFLHMRRKVKEQEQARLQELNIRISALKQEEKKLMNQVEELEIDELTHNQSTTMTALEKELSSASRVRKIRLIHDKAANIRKDIKTLESGARVKLMAKARRRSVMHSTNDNGMGMGTSTVKEDAELKTSKTTLNKFIPPTTEASANLQYAASVMIQAWYRGCYCRIVLWRPKEKKKLKHRATVNKYKPSAGSSHNKDGNGKRNSDFSATDMTTAARAAAHTDIATRIIQRFFKNTVLGNKRWRHFQEGVRGAEKRHKKALSRIKKRVSGESIDNAQDKAKKALNGALGVVNESDLDSGGEGSDTESNEADESRGRDSKDKLKGRSSSPASKKLKDMTNQEAWEETKESLHGKDYLELMKIIHEVRGQKEGLQEMITEVTWRYHQAEKSIADLTDDLELADHEIKRLDTMHEVEMERAHFRDDESTKIKEMLVTMQNLSEEVNREKECEHMQRIEYEMRILDSEERAFHSLGYSRFLEEQLFDARKREKMLASNISSGLVGGKDRGGDGERQRESSYFPRAPDSSEDDGSKNGTGTAKLNKSEIHIISNNYKSKNKKSKSKGKEKLRKKSDDEDDNEVDVIGNKKHQYKNTYAKHNFYGQKENKQNILEDPSVQEFGELFNNGDESESDSDDNRNDNDSKTSEKKDTFKNSGSQAIGSTVMSTASSAIVSPSTVKTKARHKAAQLRKELMNTKNHAKRVGDHTNDTKKHLVSHRRGDAKGKKGALTVLAVRNDTLLDNDPDSDTDDDKDIESNNNQESSNTVFGLGSDNERDKQSERKEDGDVDNENNGSDQTDEDEDPNDHNRGRLGIARSRAIKQTEDSLNKKAAQKSMHAQAALDNYKVQAKIHEHELVAATMERLVQELKRQMLVLEDAAKVKELEHRIERRTDIATIEELTQQLKNLKVVRDLVPEEQEAYLNSKDFVSKEKNLGRLNMFKASKVSPHTVIIHGSTPFMLLHNLLDLANEDAYFGGNLNQIRGVVETVLDIRKELEKLAVDVQNRLDETVAGTIYRRDLSRLAIQEWIRNFYALTGREPEAADKNSSSHFVNFAKQYSLIQDELSRAIVIVRGNALHAENMRYQYEAGCHFIMRVTGKRPLPFKYRFVVPNEKWSEVEDPMQVRTDKSDGRTRATAGHSCAVLSLLSASTGPNSDMMTFKPSSPEKAISQSIENKANKLNKYLDGPAFQKTKLAPETHDLLKLEDELVNARVHARSGSPELNRLLSGSPY